MKERMIMYKILWISVDKALPNKNGEYLVAYYRFLSKEYGYDVACFSKTGKRLHFVNSDISKDKNIWHIYDSEYGDVPINSVEYWAEIPRIGE